MNRHKINRSVDLGDGYTEIAAGFSIKRNEDGSVSRIKLDQKIIDRIRLSETPKLELRDLILLLSSEGVSVGMLLITLGKSSYNLSTYQIYLNSGDFAVNHDGMHITFPEEAIASYNK